MRLAAILLGIFALLAIAGGIFAYWIGSAFLCVDVCPPVSFAEQQLPVLAAFTLGPGLLLSLAAWILSLLYVWSQGRTTIFIALLTTPLIVAIAGVLILLLAGGSLTPVAVSGPPEVAPADRQISSEWLDVTRYAVLPLLLWPLVSFLATLLLPTQPRG